MRQASTWARAPRYIILSVLMAAAVPLALAMAVIGWLISWVSR